LLQVTAPSELQLEADGDESQAESNESHAVLMTLSLFLRDLINLSENFYLVSRASSRGAAVGCEGWGSEWGGGLALAKGKLCL